MVETVAQERLQPSLLDRLIDDEPDKQVESDDRRVLTKQAIRQAVLRDLAWLLNAVGYHPELPEKVFSLANSSVINFGLPAMSGQYSSSMDKALMEKILKQAIIRFEPRILAKTLEIEVVMESYVMDSHNRVGLVIKGMLWAQPVPLEFLLRSRIDLEEGRFTVEDVKN